MRERKRAVEYLRDGGHGFTRRGRETMCAVCGFGEFNDNHKLSLKERLLQAVETAITSDEGLDGLDGEELLREAGYWPPRKVTEPIPWSPEKKLITASSIARMAGNIASGFVTNAASNPTGADDKYLQWVAERSVQLAYLISNEVEKVETYYEAKR